MLPAAFIKGYDQRRLRTLLTTLFLALAIPTGAVIWQAYDQLKWEAWYQYRNQAEELTNRIDLAIGQRVEAAEARNFTDFSFANATASANVLNRSPLSAMPVLQELPGVIGYFQVDPDGKFSTPLLPGNDQDSAEFGLAQDDYLERQELANNIRQVLADNQLVTVSLQDSGRISSELTETEEIVVMGARQQIDNDDEALSADRPDTEGEKPQAAQAVAMTTFSSEQQGFDQLNQPGKLTEADSIATFAEDLAPASATLQSRATPYGRVDELQLDEDLQKKSEDQNREIADEVLERKEAPQRTEARKRRVEESVAAPSPAESMGGMAGGEVATITTFQSEIDPYQFSLLDSGHLVLFRNVWRNGSRYVQGLLLDQAEFSSEVLESAFRSTALFEMSNLVIGYNDDIINLINGGTYNSRLTSASELDGALLYRGTLSAPFNNLELIFAVNKLPQGPGAAVLGWTTIVIGVVFVGGFFALYRLGLSQIKLARQQQDFVSAVSHELKTPLTSIRMYGEMLKEGWADEAKQKQYYEYIHDESERLTRLISNVLQLAKITRNDPQVDLKPTQVSALMDQVRSKISSQVERAGFELEFSQDASADDIALDLDDDCFAQIVINLVDNAIKFSKDSEHKKIGISSSLSAAGRVTFAVRDYGPGIPKDQLKKIFKMFYRTESELTRETVGTGIGLAIVHQLTTAMNGSVDVINLEPGVEFRVSFPA
jgi:signal transduction histidine kinase